ncbi:MAG: hypothetical protein R3190_15515, partial [Thermoanaerobaculia bacterium]|nr:hypothetical protein [Thermoanaerobaculia bacterium]
MATAIAAIAAATAQAQEPAGDRPGTAEEEQVRQELAASSRRWVGTLRVRVSSPQLLSVGVGALNARQSESHRCVAVCHYRGLVVAAEPGLGGGQVSIGWARLVGDRRGGSP